jgi:uncharacterized membrane protein SirB2
MAAILTDPQLFGLAKSIHLITVVLTISGFLLRSYWMLCESPLLQNRIVKTVPHINDTVLLLAAIWTAAIIGQYPFVNGWLTAKILGAIAYILCGGIALSYGPTRRIRIVALVGALLCFAYVVYVAITKNPLPF